MKIIIDIGHPAHVHLFKNFAHIMQNKGHNIFFTIRDKEFETELLSHENFSFTVLGRHYKSKAGKILGLVIYNLKILMISIGYKPDLYLSHGSVYTLLSSFILRKPNIALEDTGNYEQVMLYRPFSSAILTSTSFQYRYGEKQIYYKGYHELAYLHPNYFTPDPGIRKELNLKADEKFFILRFVSWKASHDIGQSGLTSEQKKEIVTILKGEGRVFISSESVLPSELEPFRFPLTPERMHHALAFAEMFAGEGATMASECAILGTAAIYVNSLQRGYTTEQEKDYGLVHNFICGKDVPERIKELLEQKTLKEECLNKRKKLLNDKIDVTAFLVWFIETWPGSFRIMRKNPEYQDRFK
jgi:predicted glycosyltransferase